MLRNTGETACLLPPLPAITLHDADHRPLKAARRHVSGARPAAGDRAARRRSGWQLHKNVNFFRGRWHRDILWLLDQGKRYGFAAKLDRKVEYIWRSTTGELAKQSVLFRFTWFVETLKTMGWCGLLQSAREWNRGLTGAAATAPSVYRKPSCIPLSAKTGR